MKKSYFKLLSVFLLTFGVLSSIISCSNDNEKELESIIAFGELPSDAQKLINDYFGGKENISKIEKQTSDNLIIYVVETADGYEIVFNQTGEWQQIVAPYNKTVPSGLIPEPIMQTLSVQYHGYGINEINTTGQNYHIVLSDNQGGSSIELIFNQSGEILSTGDMD